MEPTKEPILPLAVKRWLLLLAVSILSALVGRYLPGTPIPPLPELRELMDAMKRIESTQAKQTDAMRAAGLPVQ